MANLASGDWTIAFQTRQNVDTVITNRKKFIDLKLTLASGKEFPGAGVIMPGANSAGLVRNLDHYIMRSGPIDPITFTTGITTVTDGIMFAYSVTGNKLHAYRGDLTSGTGIALQKVVSGDGVIKKTVHFVTAVGW